MTALRRRSSLRSSISSQRPSDPFEQQLSEEIKARIEFTTIGVPDNEAQIRRFLPKGDLAAILSVQALRPYLKELLGESTDELIDTAVDAIIGDPSRDGSSRRALLALFLYHRRTGLLSLFRDWLLSRQDNFPSDRCLPFNQRNLDQYGIPSRYHDYIKDYQALFVPVTFRQNIHQTFDSKERLPYIGAPLAIQDGSSGTVYTRRVAPRHWEEKLDNGRYTAAETAKPTVLAFKVFSGGRTGKDAQTNFEIERSMLEDLRNSNFAHRMILLDWGSFVIRDEEHRVIQHCLVFECATYTLEEFLIGAQVAQVSWTGSLLLSNVVDIVQALACLHDNFDTLHLDIKPDNILVFDRLRSQSEDGTLIEARFEWKISDFGLARTRNAKERTGPLYDANRSASHSTSLLATRPAGRFQAPEVQQRGSSKASRSSDVWSMGCIVLMVLGFVVDSPTKVSNLLGRLRVEFLNAGGLESLFYVTSDSIQWRIVTGVDFYCYDYLDKYRPVPGLISDGRQIQAAVHPEVVEWSNELFRYCHDRPEQAVLKDALGIVFKRVLLIERDTRIEASSLSKLLAYVRDRWRKMEEAPKGPNECVGEPYHQQILVPGQRKDSIQGEEDFVQQGPAPLNAQSSSSMVSISPSSVDQDPGTQSPSAESTRDPTQHSKLCSAITQMSSSSAQEDPRSWKEIQDELRRDNEQIKRPCPHPNCQRHPIHVAIRNKSYATLSALLVVADSEILKIQCPGCGDRTALEEACQTPGDIKALKCFKPHLGKVQVTKEFYDNHKASLSRYAKEALKDLQHDAVPRPTGKNLLQRVFTSSST
ncbi:hypothetical protein OPT61_g1629 [Boeremia exigua]|uniref:Uncharacterized protein n=1 Tax=Boeremia exigua TaxID=749465 RepID=A0ACC2IPR1_9PLEO|nr:hypothetical protein OPT61_g1629 [Boeremia exigua]